MPVTAEQCWDAIFRLGADDLASNDIPDDIVAKLSEFNITSVAADGIPHLTPYGKSCFDVLITGNGSVPELNELAKLDEQGALIAARTLTAAAILWDAGRVQSTLNLTLPSRIPAAHFTTQPSMLRTTILFIITSVAWL